MGVGRGGAVGALVLRFSAKIFSLIREGQTQFFATLPPSLETFRCPCVSIRTTETCDVDRLRTARVTGNSTNDEKRLRRRS